LDTKTFALGTFWSFQAPSSKAPHISSTNAFVLNPSRAFELELRKLHKKPNVKICTRPFCNLPSFELESSYICQSQWFLHWRFLELLSSKLGSSKRSQGKRICVQFLIFNKKSWRPNTNFFALASLPTLKLRAQELQERLMQILLPQSSSKEYFKTTTSKPYTNSKHSNRKEKK